MELEATSASPRPKPTSSSPRRALKYRLRRHLPSPSLLSWLSISVKNILSRNTRTPRGPHLTIQEITTNFRAELLRKKRTNRHFKRIEFEAIESSFKSLLRRTYDVLSVFKGLGLIEGKNPVVRPTKECLLYGRNAHPKMDRLTELQRIVMEKSYEVDRKSAYCKMMSQLDKNLEWFKAKSIMSNEVPKLIRGPWKQSILHFPLIIIRFKQGSKKNVKFIIYLRL
jgi:hypothetical protein